LNGLLLANASLLCRVNAAPALVPSPQQL
jgi:hypothetical protein